jgi:hypothetical protein
MQEKGFHSTPVMPAQRQIRQIQGIMGANSSKIRQKSPSLGRTG